jgi:CheY-like chemotaxis protein
MLTSSEKRHDAKRSRNLGVSSCITKPVRRAELRDALMKALQTETADSGHTSAPALQPPEMHAEGTVPSCILLVEDNVVNQRVARRILERAGHKVILASNGKEALAILRRDRFDVVLMDGHMPELDGFETTKAIRSGEAGEDRQVPIIAMTALAMTGDRERCLAAGMDDYISKPVSAGELLRLVRLKSRASGESEALALLNDQVG